MKYFITNFSLWITCFLLKVSYWGSLQPRSISCGRSALGHQKGKLETGVCMLTWCGRGKAWLLRMLSPRLMPGAHESHTGAQCVSLRAKRFWKSSIACQFFQDHFDYNISLTLGYLLWPKLCLMEMNFISFSSWTLLIRNSFIHWLPCTIILQMS